MSGPDYLQFKQTYRNSLLHSPKGTTWKNHKYIQKDGRRYIYQELQRKVHSMAKNGKNDMDRLEDSIKDLYEESKKPIKETTEVLLDRGQKAIKSLFSKELAMKTYKLSSDVVDKGWDLLGWILKEKR